MNHKLATVVNRVPQNRRVWRIYVVLTASLALLVLSSWLRWRTSTVDRDGRLPVPALSLGFPGGILQSWARQDGVHFLAMAGNNRYRIQLEPLSHYGASGYNNFGTCTRLGDFTFAFLTEMVLDYDYYVSPHAALVVPYWCLIGTGLLGTCWSSLTIFRRPRPLLVRLEPSTSEIPT